MGDLNQASSCHGLATLCADADLTIQQTSGCLQGLEEGSVHVSTCESFLWISNSHIVGVESMKA